jgi:hypothetical protein
VKMKKAINKVKIERKFAWVPVLLRNKLTTSGPFRLQTGCWFRWYTRIYRWDGLLDPPRYRTYDTFKAKIPKDKVAEVIEYVSGTPA